MQPLHCSLEDMVVASGAAPVHYCIDAVGVSSGKARSRGYARRPCASTLHALVFLKVIWARRSMGSRRPHSLLGVLATYFLIWIVLLREARVAAQNRNDEVRTLLRFKETVAGRWPEVFWSSWKKSDENACAWAGVTCSANYTVAELNLSSWFPTRVSLNLDALSSLRDLRQLDLSSNGLYYVYLRNLTGLTVLDLSYNRLREVPEGVCNLTRLARLDLSSNNIYGRMFSSISACRSLRHISLQQNHLSGAIPNLRGLVDLQFLLVAHNELSGPFPSHLGQLSNLLFVDLSHNLFNGTIPALPNLTSLVQLQLDNNSFTGFEKPWSLGAGGGSALQRFSVSQNQLEGPIPSAIVELKRLEYLNMSQNRLSESIPFGFSKLEKLLTLDLSQNRLRGEVPDALVRNSTFSSVCSVFNLSHNLLSGVLSGTAKGSCFDLLDLSHNNLSGPISSVVDSDTGIFELSLQNNRLSGDIVDALLAENFRRIVLGLQLQNNYLTGDVSRIAKHDSGLYCPPHVDLSNNHLRWRPSEVILDPMKATLEKLGVASDLLLGGNNLSGMFLPTSCPNGSAQDSNGPDLRKLRTLDLSNSQLTGQISGAVFSASCLPSLRNLNLSNNDISGSVPVDILGLADLQVIDMSSNDLSGPLPPIPVSSSLFDPRIFADNIGLCGLPLEKCPDVYPGVRLQWWVLLLIIGGSLSVTVGSCLLAAWRWKVYQRRHQQDADLIQTLLERDAATLMSLRDLKAATANFAQSARIGEGGFGTVYKGTLNDGTLVAIKRSKREGTLKDKEQFLNEVRILSQVNHRNLVKLLGCCMENRIAVLVFEFVANGTLQDHLQGKAGAARLSWKQRLNIAVQTAQALAYLHTECTFAIYHRDVKSANILLDEKLNAKVADFGISRLAPVQATHVSTLAVQGTMGYIDPEYYTSYQLTDKSDVFSFGVVLLELISAKPALDIRRSGEDKSLVYFADPHITGGDLEAFVDPTILGTYSDAGGHGRESILNVGRLARRCVSMRSKDRPAMTEVWKELQNLSVQLNLTTKDDCETIRIEDGEFHWDHGVKEYAERDRILLLSTSFASERSRPSMQSEFSDMIQMSQFSQFSQVSSTSP